MKIKGILTNCVTNEEKEVELEYETKICDGRRVFFLLNGVTGWESFCIDSEYSNIEEMKEHGWLACAGTPKKYDKLFVSAKEMRKALDGIEKIPNLTNKQNIMINLNYLEEQKNIKQKEIEYMNNRIKKLKKELSNEIHEQNSRI